MPQRPKRMKASSRGCHSSNGVGPRPVLGAAHGVRRYLMALGVISRCSVLSLGALRYLTAPGVN